MIPIKFRIWDVKSKFMRGDGPFDLRDIACGVDDISEFLANERPCVILQFTGLLDKNGKEIYDGDVLQEGGQGEGCDDNPSYSSVFWNVDHWETKWGNLGDVCEDAYLVGNIHENPELLVR